jgi:DNA-binding transcriptional regulator LsrR (DeoR family)
MGRRLDQGTKNEIIQLAYEEGISTRSLVNQLIIGRTTIQTVLRDYRTANDLEIRSNKGALAIIPINKRVIRYRLRQL